jgi:4-hydroxy-tetrahydrodipicolinate reductase
MGKEIEAAAIDAGDTIVQKFDIDRPANVASLADADVCIEFSTPETVVGNIQLALQAQKDIVVGTTGWHDRVPELKKQVVHSGLLYSANFSVGVNMYYRIVAAAAELMQNYADYDPYIHELHHRQKADSPSCTALRLADIVLTRINRKKEIATQRMDGRISPDALHVTSTRVRACKVPIRWDLIRKPT